MRGQPKELFHDVVGQGDRPAVGQFMRTASGRLLGGGGGAPTQTVQRQGERQERCTSGCPSPVQREKYRREISSALVGKFPLTDAERFREQWKKDDFAARYQLHLIRKEIPAARKRALVIWIALAMLDIFKNVGGLYLAQNTVNLTNVRFNMPLIPQRVQSPLNQSLVYEWLEATWPRSLDQRWPSEHPDFPLGPGFRLPPFGRQATPGDIDGQPKLHLRGGLHLLVTLICVLLSLLPFHPFFARAFYVLQSALLLGFVSASAYVVTYLKRSNSLFAAAIVPAVVDLDISPAGHPLTQLIEGATQISPLVLSSLLNESAIITVRASVRFTLRPAMCNLRGKLAASAPALQRPAAALPLRLLCVTRCACSLSPAAPALCHPLRLLCVTRCACSVSPAAPALCHPLRAE